MISGPESRFNFHRRRPLDLDQLTLMHNHYHCVATDPLGLRVDFTKEALGLIARCIKELRGHDGMIFELCSACGHAD